MAQQAITKADVSRAHAQLRHMRGKLMAWLKYRKLNDEVAAGRRASRLAPEVAARTMGSTRRDWATEQKLADHLYALLSEVSPDARLPVPDVTANPNVAVVLAQMAITGRIPGAAQAQGSSHPWLWPVLIVGGLLLAVTSAVSSYADVAKSQEQYQCIEAGACTDYGFWLKAAAVLGVGWFAWTQAGVRERVKALGKGGR